MRDGAVEKEMNANVQQTESPMLNIAKLLLAVLVLVGGVFAFYYFSDAPQGWRVLGILAAVGVAIAIAAFTSQGRAARHYMAESQFELRKVVWPTRQETIQTTLVVIVVVIILSIILWLIDMLLGAVILQWLLQSG
jgi:preprotein translocase subunit SecE